MSRQIDLSQELSDSDRLFLEERGQYRDLAMNEALLREEDDRKAAEAERAEADAKRLEAEEAAKAAAEAEQARIEEQAKAQQTPQPNKSASKPEWVAYAVSQGMPQAEAEAATRDELVQRFTV